MICPACGAANEDGVLFCETCKADLEMPAVAPTAPLMTESVFTPPVEEPILLEPVEETPTIKIAAQVEQGLPSSPSSDDHPVVPVSPQPPLFPSEYPTIELSGAILAQIGGPAEDDYPTAEPPLAQSSASPNPKLIVVRGQRVDALYPIFPGKNYIGRTDDMPVDIDIEDQEAADRIWSSRQHAVIHFEEGKLTLEDLNSLNGTFVNRTRVHPGQMKELLANDVIQIGTVHMKVALE